MVANEEVWDSLKKANAKLVPSGCSKNGTEGKILPEQHAQAAATTTFFDFYDSLAAVHK